MMWSYSFKASAVCRVASLALATRWDAMMTLPRSLNAPGLAALACSMCCSAAW